MGALLDLRGKKYLIFGVANDKSIAYGIAENLAAAGATLAFAYQNEVLLKRVKPLAEGLGVKALYQCDVSSDASLDAAFAQVKSSWGTVDGIVHAVAFSDKDELKGDYADTSRENFRNSLDVSCYSFTAIARRAADLMPEGGSLITLSYYGAEKVMPHYNVMGVAKAALEASVRYLAADYGKRNIRVNGISAGPIRTLAAAGIGDFRYILKWNQYNSPLRRNVTQDEVGKAALFLLSDMASGVTGEILHVDAGYHVVGMKAVDAPDINVAKDE
ncbi:MAG: enoyl-ACP reductase FabI [Holosporales bacterium]|jgi:enoyl-[acyl-carrier protein] reductase I